MSLVDESMSGMTGLKQLQSLIARSRGPSIGVTLDFKLVEISHDGAVFEGTPSDKVLNPLGAVHGGYAATLLDSACGCAVHARLSATQAFTTLELKVAYHRAISDSTGTVRAEGKVISMGRRVAFTEARLIDKAGKLLASASSTLLVFER